MAGPFGVSFSPTSEGSAESAQQQAHVRRSSTPLQVLNFSMPTRVQPGAPAAKALLTPHATSGAPDQAVMASIVRALMGSHAPIPASAGLTAQRAMARGEESNAPDEWVDGKRRVPVSTASRDAGPFPSSVGPAPAPASIAPPQASSAPSGYVYNPTEQEAERLRIEDLRQMKADEALIGEDAYDRKVWNVLDNAKRLTGTLGSSGQSSSHGPFGGGGSMTPNVTFPVHDKPEHWEREGGW